MSKQIILFLILSTLLVACGGESSSQTAADFNTPVPNQVEIHQDTDRDDQGHEHIEESQATVDMQVVLVPSEIVLGPNRFAVGLMDSAGRMIHDAEVHFDYYDLNDPDAAIFESEADAVSLHAPDGYTTIFTQEREFARTGLWGVEVHARLAGGTVARERIGFEVLADSPSVGPGEKVPVIDTPTLADVSNDLQLLSSAEAPNPAFYELSLAEAVANGKPTVLLFATPAFCQTRFCGPAYEVTSQLQERYGEAANFIHVEVFTGLPNPAANYWEPAPAMTAFSLSSEPWLYFIDSQGTVVYRLEGLFTDTEIERQLRALLSL